MAEIKVSQLPEASEINDNDLIMIVQNNVNKKITKENCKFASGDEVAVSDTEPTGEESESVKLWIDPTDAPSGSGFELNKFYPVGSIYINTTGVNPSTFMGGTWEAFGNGKVLVGQDTTDTDFDTLLDTGGSKELQQHNHTISGGEFATASSDLISAYGSPSASGFKLGSQSTTNNAGTGNSGNLQPYIVVSMWVRTA